MKKINLIYMLSMLVFFTACDKDKFLDITPYGVLVPQTVEDFRLLMDQRESAYSTDASVGRQPLHELDLLMSDDVKVPAGNASTYVGTSIERYLNALTWEEHFCGPEELDKDYQCIYNQLLVANIVLENMADPSVTGDEDMRNQLIAEAKVHRAAAHFAAVNLYAAQYNPATAANDLGIVIKVSTELGASIRGTVQEAYDIILKDLTEAIASGDLENDVPEYNWRASNAGAYGYLARVYLQMGDYNNALTAANNALQIHNVLNDYNTLGNNLQSTWLNEEVLLAKTPPKFIQSTSVFLSDELSALYDTDDLRTRVRFNLDWRTGDLIYYTRYFDRNYMVIGPGVGEMYMIRAECNARLGSGDPIADLNTLRATRYATGTYVDLVAEDFADADALLTFVLEERRRELAFSGVRFFDLKRFNALHDANISITRTIDGETTVLEANSNRWIAPIARKIISEADGLVQSPR